MSWPKTVLLCVVDIWGLLILSDWLKLREQRRERQDAATKEQPPAHSCVGRDLEVIAAKPLADITTVMKRCRYCGHHFVFSYPGAWTTEDFLKTQSDSKWLKEQIG